MGLFGLGDMLSPDKMASMLFSFMPESEIKAKIAEYTPQALEHLNKWLNENAPLKEELEELKHSLLLFEQDNTMMAQIITLDRNWEISRIILTKDVKELVLSLNLEQLITNLTAQK